jgi:TRAP-type C4-dicarboxylate transport system substrate-binding protein
VAFDNYWVGASQAWFSGLNADTQAKLRELIGKAMTYQNDLNWCNDQFAIRKYKAAKASDPGIYVATSAEAKPLQEAIGNNVADYLKGKLPKEAHPWVDRYLKEGRAASARLGPGTDPVEKLDCAKYESVLKK